MVQKHIFVVLFLLLSIQQTCAAPVAQSASQRDNKSTAELEQGIFEGINRVRQTNGLNPLKQSADLQKLARAQSRDMAENGYMGHVDSRGRDLKARLKDAKITGWREIGENVARAFGYERIDEEMVKGWLRSKTHRANIMSREFDSTGVGVVKGSDGYFYAAQIFIWRDRAVTVLGNTARRGGFGNAGP
ncbi:MAG: allergen V5/Tpx-1-like [Geobacteraceae bacterium]|nr:MAG: allergen V5/Tpx-1-like [Geobacteraceae bacterium]